MHPTPICVCVRVRATTAPALAFALVAVACHPADPPAPKGVDPAISPMPGPGAAPATHANASPDSGADLPRGRDPRPVAAAEARPDADAATTAATPDPGTLPQTKDKPSATGSAFDARVAALWDAIVHDDPERGMPFFFPVSAYEQVKGIANPASDWRRRLVAAYRRDIHGLHTRLGARAESATFARIDVPDDRARWVEPNEEYNKLGYFRVYGTRLVHAVDGKERAFDVSSLISWRGEWYVVHLTGFK